MSSKKKLSSPEKPLFEIQKNEDVQLLTKKEIAEFLNVSVGLIDKKVMLKEIPFLKIGKLVRFSKSGIMEWMQKELQNEVTNGKLLR